MTTICFLFIFCYQKPICPPLWKEVTPVFKRLEEVNVTDMMGKKYVLECKDGKCMGLIGVTTTIDSYGMRSIQTGTATDTEAVEHNKKVEQCRVANGLF